MMDQPDLDVRRHVHALDALGRANAVSRTAGAVWPSIRAAALDTAPGPLRVLDIASGGGHLLVSLARQAARERMDIDWLGWDVSAVAIDYARTLAESRGVKGVRFERADALHGPIPPGIDVVLCTLFLHHLTESDAVALLQRMGEAAGRAVVVSDLRRTRLGAAFTWAGCRLLSRSKVFRVDGMRSVAAAFSTGEARSLAAAAGLNGAQVFQVWPQRWLLTWRKRV
ncbi:MAG: methyltransferase domain-containing protein [Vicinamibacterales bacterium]|nr:methyltransferase domain-containing protein [Vicinamibacterales bacterium]